MKRYLLPWRKFFIFWFYSLWKWKLSGDLHRPKKIYQWHMEVLHAMFSHDSYVYCLSMSRFASTRMYYHLQVNYHWFQIILSTITDFKSSCPSHSFNLSLTPSQNLPLIIPLSLPPLPFNGTSSHHQCLKRPPEQHSSKYENWWHCSENFLYLCMMHLNSPSFQMAGYYCLP